MVETVCYGKVMSFETREEAMAFYKEGMKNSEGSEHDRYFRIWCQLDDGYDFATDEE